MAGGVKSYLARWLGRTGAAPVTPSTTTGVSSGQLLISSGHLMLRADSGSVNLRTKGPELMLVTT